MCTTLLFNMGLPMIFPSMYLMVLALIPVALAEGFMITRSLHLAGSVGYQASLFGNLAMTILGIPATWFLLVILQMVTGGQYAYGFETFWQKTIAVTWQAPWLIPYYERFPWVVYAAMMFLLIPYFFSSWYLEYIVTRKFIAKRIYSRVKKQSGLASDSDIIEKLETEALYPDISLAIRRANILSYGALAVILAVPLLTNLAGRE